MSDAAPGQGGGVARGIALGLGVVMMIATLPALVIAFTAIFLFDAPGSTDSPLTWALALGMMASPIVTLAGATYAFMAAARYTGFRMAAAVVLPCALIAYLVVAYMLLEMVCGGHFAC